MPYRLSVVGLLLAGCQPEAGTGDSGTDTNGIDIPDGVGCASTDNGLVFRCTATLDAAGPATLEVTGEGVVSRRFASSADDTAHALYAWGLHPDTEYTWQLAGETGTFTTGPLPSALDPLTVTVAGSLIDADAVLVYVDCGYFVMLDENGDVIWYAETSVYNNLPDGMRWSQADRSVLALSDSAMGGPGGGGASAFEETHISGATPLTLAANTDFSLRLTHDVARWGTLTYLLAETEGSIGGFEVFDGTQKVGQWLLDEAFGEVTDLSRAHVNGLSVSDNGEVVLSIHAFDGIVAVDGDPASPSFLSFLWHASGDPGGQDDLPDADYVPDGDPLFSAQHHASRYGDELWVFDNGSQATARALRMQMDHEAGTLTELDAWSMGQSCRNQGGAVPLEGGVLATCANSKDVYAFRDEAGDPEWLLNATCGTGGAGPLGQNGSTRAYPVYIE